MSLKGKPKDPIWDFYNVIGEGENKVAMCKDCDSSASAKSERLKVHNITNIT